MRSPIVAMLWENWRLSRVEAAQRLSFGIVGGSVALALFDSATFAFWVLLSQHGIFWMSIAKLNGGRFLDGYKPGFPLHLLYTRPVPTFVLVGVAMAYDAVSCAAMYLASAALLEFAFGQPLPMLSAAVWIVAFHLISTAVQWSMRNRVVQYLGSFGLCMPFFLLIYRAGRSPLQIEFSLTEVALMAAMGVASFGLTVAGVARQRRGDGEATAPRTAGSAGYPDWLASLFRIPCPISSATRAQVWFELKSSGLPVVAIGAAIAIVNALLFAISIPAAWLRPLAVGCAIFAGPALLILGGNAFGLRRKQGRTYAVAFSVTQPYGTAGLAGLKVLVRSVCVLGALVVVGVSVWTSSSLISEWDYSTGETVLIGPVREQIEGKEWVIGMLRARRAFGDAVRSQTAYQTIALALIASIGIAMVVALRAARTALWARYPRRLLVAGSLLLLHGLALVVLAVPEQRGVEWDFLINALFFATRWVAAAATALTTVYLLRRAIAERLLTLGYACGVLLVTAAFAAAWLTMLRDAGVQLAGTPAAHAVWMLLPTLLPLTVSLLAPWSLNRIRHI